MHFERMNIQTYREILYREVDHRQFPTTIFALLTMSDVMRMTALTAALLAQRPLLSCEATVRTSRIRALYREVLLPWGISSSTIWIK